MTHTPHVTSLPCHTEAGKVIQNAPADVQFAAFLRLIRSFLCFHAAKKHGADGNFFEIITSDEVHYFLQAAMAEERKDWIQAVQAVAKSNK